jgi:glycosyltransferase involved in cell wall biosynthesis
MKTVNSTNSKIKVIHIIQSLESGGAEVSLLGILKNINKKRFDISLVSFWKGDAIEDEFAKLENINVIYLECSSRYDIRIYFRLLKILRKENPDIIHTHLPIAGIYSRLCKFNISSKYVTSQHSVKSNNNIFHKFNKFTGKINDFYIANSAFTRQFLIDNDYCNSDKIRIINLGIDFDKFKIIKKEKTNMLAEYRIPQNAFIIGHIGSFKHQKGHVYLIKAAEMLIKQNSKIYLILIGDGELLFEMQRLSEKLQIAGNLRFVGKKNNIAEFLNIMDIFVMPSISESFGISVLEAMYMKVPVVAFATEALPELVKDGETGILIDKADTFQLSNAVNELYNDNELKEHLIQKAYDFVKNRFSIKFTTNELELFYSEILSNNEKN